MCEEFNAKRANELPIHRFYNTALQDACTCPNNAQTVQMPVVQHYRKVSWDHGTGERAPLYFKCRMTKRSF